jgi:Family of unknown function (DUF6370)
MLRTLCCGLGVLALGLILVGDASLAQEKKEVTLKGKITCAKCELGVAKACETVIVVKKDAKDVVYHFDAASHKKYHNDICQEGKEGQVTGTVADQGKKKIVTVKDLKYN